MEHVVKKMFADVFLCISADGGWETNRERERERATMYCSLIVNF